MKTDWWKLPALVTGAIACLTTLGGVAIHYATFAGLPKRVEAVETENRSQEVWLEKLSVIQEQNARLIEVYVSPDGVGQTVQEWDAEGRCWVCPGGEREACWAQQTWRPC